MAAMNPYEDDPTYQDPVAAQQAAERNGWGTQSTATVLPSTLEAGDPQYNARQQEFESTVDWDALTKMSQQAAADAGVEWDPSDVEGIRRNAGYDQVHLGDAGLYNSALLNSYNNLLQNYNQRATNKNGEASNDGSATTLRGIGQVGGDPFTDTITQAILDLINNKGDINGDQRLLQRRESLREEMDRARKSQQDSLYGQLLSRGLVSEPGIPQGMEISGLGNIEEKLAPIYATSLRDILSDESATQNANYLAALGLGNTRQQTLSDIALGTLDRNMAWNEFLAQYGLDRDNTLATLSNGGNDILTQLLNQFLVLSGQSSSGHT